MIRGHYWLQSFTKFGRESRKLINSGSNLPSASRHIAPMHRLFSSDISRIALVLCMHRRVCVISLAAWPSLGKKTFERR